MPAASCIPRFVPSPTVPPDPYQYPTKLLAVTIPVAIASLLAPGQLATRMPMPLLAKLTRLLDKIEVAREVESRAEPTLGVLLVVGESRGVVLGCRTVATLAMGDVLGGDMGLDSTMTS